MVLTFEIITLVHYYCFVKKEYICIREHIIFLNSITKNKYRQAASVLLAATSTNHGTQQAPSRCIAFFYGVTVVILYGRRCSSETRMAVTHAVKLPRVRLARFPKQTEIQGEPQRDLFGAQLICCVSIPKTAFPVSAAHKM